MTNFTPMCTQRCYVVEVAPQPLITPQRYSSISPRLDTIYEEGSHAAGPDPSSSPESDREINRQGQGQGDHDRTVEICLTRTVAHPLPRLIHLLTYGFTRGLPANDYFRTC